MDMSGAHCHNRVGTGHRGDRKEPGRNCSYPVVQELMCCKRWVTGGEGATEKDREEPEWTIFGDSQLEQEKEGLKHCCQPEGLDNLEDAVLFTMLANRTDSVSRTSR